MLLEISIYFDFIPFKTISTDIIIVKEHKTQIYLDPIINQMLKSVQRHFTSISQLFPFPYFLVMVR